MIRLAALTAVALMASVPANAESLRVSLVGKSSETVQSEILAAAKTVCAEASRSDPFSTKVQCVNATVKDALNQIGSPKTASASSTELAAR